MISENLDAVFVISIQFVETLAIQTMVFSARRRLSMDRNIRDICKDCKIARQNVIRKVL